MVLAAEVSAARALFDLSGRRALVLGASRGIGRALAEGLAGVGASVGIASRTARDVDECVRAIRASGGSAEPFTYDALDIAGLHEFIGSAIERLGGIDIFVHIAGTNRRKPAVDLTEEDWDAVVDLNLRSFFFASQAVGRAWIEARPSASELGHRRKIIGVGSLASAIGLAGMAPYAASKTGLLGVVRVLAVEWARHGICVNAVAPGYIETEFTRPVQEDAARSAWVVSRIPMGRWGTPSDLVGAALFLASSASDYVTGQAIYVDGGWLAA